MSQAGTVPRVRLPLVSGQVDIWLTAALPQSDHLEDAYLRLLAPPERERWQRFLARSAQNQYLVARALLRETLSRYADVPPGDWVFETNAHGRPLIAAPGSFRSLVFSLSHTEGLVACAVASSCELGIDAENMDREIDAIALAQSAFASAEAEAVAAAAAPDRRRLFFSYWTLKEAYVKARGLGLSIPLNAFWFEPGGPAPRIHFTEGCEDLPARWQFHQFAPTETHLLAVAVSSQAGAPAKVALHWTTPLGGEPLS